jgi:hypothetical protein
MPSRYDATLRHARYYAHLADSIDMLYMNGKQIAALDVFDREREQIDAGWQWVRQCPVAHNTSRLLLDYANRTIFVGDLRYDKRRERIPHFETMGDAARLLGDQEAESISFQQLGDIYCARRIWSRYSLREASISAEP